jgi:hypothetical protein
MTSAFPTFAAAPRTLPRALWRAATWLWRKLWRPPAIVLAVLIVAHVTLNVISGRRLEAELNKLRARGAPLTLAEAAPSSVPDSQNAAVLYLRAFAQLGSRSEQETIQRVVRPLRRASYPSPPTPTLAQVEPIIARHVAQFRLLREASLRPACHFPVDWNDAGGATSWHPAGMRDASDLLAAKAVVDANRGRSGDALDDLAIIMRMGNHLSAEPTLISQLVRSEVSVGEVFRVLPRVMAAAPPDAAQSRAFHDLLAKVDMVGPWVHAMEGERCFGLAVFDQFRHAKSGDGLMGMLGLSEAQSSREMLSATISRFLMRHAWPLTRAVWTPFLNLDEVLFLRRAQRAIELAAKPYRVSLRDQEALEDARGRLPWYGRVSAIASPVYAHATAARDKAIAQIGLMQAAMALRAYQIAHGSYPASLAEARAAGGWAVPDDPFSGEPFIYHRRGAGYFIYSVAEDMKNDQGIDKHTALALAPVSGRLQAAKGPKAGRRQLQPTWDVPLRMER